MVDKITLLSEAARLSFEREVKINVSLDHPFLTHYLRVRHDDNATYIIMEFASGGDLLKRIQDKHKLKENDMQHIFCEMMSALNYIHTIKHYVHRDLKLDNILFDSSGNIRIIDFGLSGEITPEKPLLSTQCGSFYYTAPEIIKKKQYSYSVDIWSCGVILYAMATGNLPFVDNNTHNLIHKITTSAPDFPPNVSAPLSDLILKMLAKNPEERITIPQIALHPWVKDCRYAFYLSENFLFSPKYRCFPKSPKDIDVDVMKRIKTLGLPSENVSHEIIDHIENDSTMCYIILKKQKVIQMIGSNAEIRMMFSMRRSVPVSRPMIDVTKVISQNNQALTPEQKRRTTQSKTVFETKKRKVNFSSQKFGSNMSLPPLRK
ncbi:CAMK family protein kinase [Tritrichomonas foetus]|uniref:CAMK family protein kinase n=1 Tax=Tritrichomonas foetus TaxID=1144522 RepID=A0A1J4JFH9_9EUKA|nr:CAMK family protein kinase [Tritrichomonas foetus]|eukprot:OHS97872.1 CAMK family protein kinase [Tritrichomonas foetus]